MMVLSVCFIHTKPLAHYPNTDFKKIEWIIAEFSLSAFSMALGLKFSNLS